MNNITEHGCNRIYRFLKIIHRHKTKLDFKNTMDFLFNPETTSIPDADMIQSIDNYLRPTRPTYFRHPKHGWYNYVPAFWKLQRFFEANGEKFFRVIPLFSHGRKSIQIDTITKCRLYKSQCERSSKIPDTERLNHKVVWAKCFNFEKFERPINLEAKTREFAYSINTDGVSVFCILMRRKKRPVKTEEQLEKEIFEFHESVGEKLRENIYGRIKGIDPGNKLMIAANSYDMSTGQEQNTKYSSKTYHWASGYHYFRHKREKIWKRTLE